MSCVEKEVRAPLFAVIRYVDSCFGLPPNSQLHPDTRKAREFTGVVGLIAAFSHQQLG
jgi:hypothetical protein